jgi:hypothetical protein
LGIGDVDLFSHTPAKSVNRPSVCSERAVEIIGFVADVIAGTPNETCNCARSDIADIHIDIVANQKDRNNNDKYVIVENFSSIPNRSWRHEIR